jgi:F-type H+-transporting ATPase subunit delta
VRDSNVASRYAQALYIVTERRGETDRALEDLRVLGEIAKPDSRTGAMLAGPLVLLSDKRAVFRKVLEGRALPSVVLFADLLLRKHRFAELPGIVHQFQGLVEKKHGIHRATVTSAVALTADERARLQSELERLTAGPVTLTEAVDAELVGGANVRIGDRLIDRSVKTLLEAIEQQLYHTSV